MDRHDIQSQITRGQQIAERLCQEFNIAASSWAHFEAINGETDQSRLQFRQSMEWLLVSNKGLLAAIIRDVVMALCRILDDPRNDGSPLIEIAKLLKKEQLRAAIIEQAHKRAPRFEIDDDFFERSETESYICKIALIRNHVPLQWKTEPKIATLYKWRNEIWPIRQKILAHPGDAASIIQPKVDGIREGLKLIEEVVGASRHIFVGSPLPNNMMRELTREANLFWDYAQTGFVETFEKDQANRMG